MSVVKYQPLKRENYFRGLEKGEHVMDMWYDIKSGAALSNFWIEHISQTVIMREN